MGRLELSCYRLFVLVLGLWTGAGVHDSIATHPAWNTDPVAWATRPDWPGLVNPWPATTAVLLLATVAAAVSVWRYHGAGRRKAMVAVGGTSLILVATLGWFVPQLGIIFGSGSALPDAELIDHSRRWIMANAVRLVLLFGVLWAALTSLSEIGPAVAHGDRRTN